MPPVCPKSVRRRSTSLTPKRSAMPGSHHTGSIAALVTFTSPEPLRMSLSGFSRPAAMASMISGMFTCALVGGVGGADAPARRELVGKHVGDQVAPRVERHDLRRIEPALEWPDP